jgi:hypothetical protein
MGDSREYVFREAQNVLFVMNQKSESFIYEYRCDERLKTKHEESTRLVDTGLVVELEHLKIKTRLVDEKFASVRGECETSMREAPRLG